MLELSPWVCVVGFVQEFVESKLISEERSRENHLFTPDNDNSLASEDFFGHF